MSNLGEVIFSTRDEPGPIRVHQNGDRRTLTFGNPVEQSGLSLIDPARLEYVYTQAMALAMRIPLQKLARNLWRQNAEVLQLGRYAAHRS